MKCLSAVVIALGALGTGATATADTYAETANWAGNYPWTNPTVWGAAPDSGCYPDNANANCGDGRWFVTLSAAPILNTSVTLTGVQTGLLTGDVSGGAVTMTIEEQFDWYTGTLGLSGGTVHLLPGCVSSISGGWNGSTLLNQGHMTQTDFMRNSGTFINDVGAEWVVNLTADNYFVWDGSGNIINHGLMRKTGPAATYPHSLDTFHISSTGELRVEEGRFTIHDSGAPYNLFLDGELDVWAGAEAVMSQPVTFGPSAKVEGAGTVRFEMGNLTADVQGTWNVSGLTEIRSGSVNFLTPCVTNDFNQCYGTLTGDVIISGDALWSDGIQTSPGTTYANGDMLIDSSINCGFAAPMTLDNRTLQLGAGTQLVVNNAGPFGSGGAVIAVPPTATMTFDTPTDYRVMSANQGEATIENDGTIIKTGPGSMNCNWSVSNRGLFDVVQGHFDVLYATVTVEPSGTLRLNDTSMRIVKPGALSIDGGRFVGEGTIEGSILGSDVFFCSGTIAPGDTGAAGLLNMHCIMTLEPGSTLELELGGTISGTDYDAISVSQSMTLDGELQLSFINGFEGSISGSDEFVLVDRVIGATAGAFTNVAPGGDLPTSDGIGVFTIWYGPTSPYGDDKVVATNYRPAPVCDADLNGDLVVNVLDLLDMLGAWGPNPGHEADLNGDDVVNVLDLLIILGAWGACG